MVTRSARPVGESGGESPLPIVTTRRRWRKWPPSSATGATSVLRLLLSFFSVLCEMPLRHLCDWSATSRTGSRRWRSRRPLSPRAAGRGGPWLNAEPWRGSPFARSLLRRRLSKVPEAFSALRTASRQPATTTALTRRRSLLSNHRDRRPPRRRQLAEGNANESGRTGAREGDAGSRREPGHHGRGLPPLIGASQLPNPNPSRLPRKKWNPHPRQSKKYPHRRPMAAQAVSLNCEGGVGGGFTHWSDAALVLPHSQSPGGCRSSKRER